MATYWHGYNKALVRRGEILLDLGLLEGWGEELEEMNGGREGGRYWYPHALIRLQGFIRACFRLPYRQLEGFTRALPRWEPRLGVPDYSTTCRRVNGLDLGLEPRLDPEGPVTIAVDATGIKVADRGEWMRLRWRRRRGFLKIHLAVDVGTRRIVALEVTDERTGDGGILKPLVELFRGRWSIERLFGRAKEWLLLDGLRVRGLAQVSIHVALSFSAMLAVALAAVRFREPGLVRSIKHFVE